MNEQTTQVLIMLIIGIVAISCTWAMYAFFTIPQPIRSKEEQYTDCVKSETNIPHPVDEALKICEKLKP